MTIAILVTILVLCVSYLLFDVLRKPFHKKSEEVKEKLNERLIEISDYREQLNKKIMEELLTKKLDYEEEKRRIEQEALEKIRNL